MNQSRKNGGRRLRKAPLIGLVLLTVWASVHTVSGEETAWRGEAVETAQTALSGGETVVSVSVVTPADGAVYEEGDIIEDEDVTVSVSYDNGTSEVISAADYSVMYTPDGALTASDTLLTVTYAGFTDYVSINVMAADTEDETEDDTGEDTEESDVTVEDVYVYVLPDKTEYTVGEALDLSGMILGVRYSDSDNYYGRSYETYSAYISADVTVFDEEGTQTVTVYYEDAGGSAETSFTVTVEEAEDAVEVYGVHSSSSYYSFEDDASIRIGDTLDWEDVFSYVYLRYYDEDSTLISEIIYDNDDLYDILGENASLTLAVYGKDEDETLVEATDADDGMVRLQLYLTYNGTAYQSSVRSITFSAELSDVPCLLTVYRSASSSMELGSVSGDDFEELLDSVEALSDIMDAFDIAEQYEDTFAIEIVLGEDAEYRYTFAPDYANEITIDLNGHTLEVDSDWIDFDDCEELTVYVFNSDDEEAELIYDDLDVTVYLSEDDGELAFDEDHTAGIYELTLESVANGSLDVSESVLVHGNTVYFAAIPDSGCGVEDLLINGTSVMGKTAYLTYDSEDGSVIYELSRVTGDITLSAEFEAVSKAEAWVNPFSDVSSYASYYDSVAYVCSEGLFTGMTSDIFAPESTMTRAMFVTVLGRMAGVDVSGYSGSSFTDVRRDDAQISWAASYIEWGASVGLLQGYGDGRFGPNDPVTHQEMYTLIYRYARLIEGISVTVSSVSLSGISDSGGVADWAEAGVKFASMYGLLVKSGSRITPNDTALRWELATLLEGFCTTLTDR